MKLLTILGGRLKQLRKEHGKKQRELAEMLDMTLRNYQRIEHGEIDVSVPGLVFLANYYHVTVDYLLGRSQHGTDSVEEAASSFQKADRETLKLLGERLRVLRREKSFRQKDMAIILDMTDVHYGRVERGKIDVPSTTLCTLAEYFGVSIDYLLGRTDRREPCG